MGLLQLGYRRSLQHVSAVHVTDGCPFQLNQVGQEWGVQLQRTIRLIYLLQYTPYLKLSLAGRAMSTRLSPAPIKCLVYDIVCMAISI